MLRRRARRGGGAGARRSPRRGGAAPWPADPLHARHAGRRRRRGDAPGRDEAWIEDKYDGIRAQLHLDPPAPPRLFSRDLNEIGRAFPEVVAAAAALRASARDRRRAGAVSGGIGARLRQPPDTPRSRAVRAPSCWSRSRSCSSPSTCCISTATTCSRRRCASAEPRSRSSRSRSGSAERFLYSHLATARSATEVERHFDDARERQNEGLMVKDPDSVYQPGRRGLGWLKLKKALATLDCVVVGVEWGHGKRRGVLSDYTFAVRETADGESHLLTIGKAYTGLTDAEIADDDRALQGDHPAGLRPLPDGRSGSRRRDRLRPDHAQRAPQSGFAMRFPRIVRIRDDKTPAEIDTLATVETLFGEQAWGGSCWRAAPRARRSASRPRRRSGRLTRGYHPRSVWRRNGDELRCRPAWRGVSGQRGRLYARLPYLRDRADAVHACGGDPQPAGQCVPLVDHATISEHADPSATRGAPQAWVAVDQILL